MTKDVIIEVCGYQKNDAGEEDSSTTKERGSFFEKDGYKYILIENPETKTKARYKFNHRSLEIVRNGDVSSKLHFESTKDHTTRYVTPYGELLLTFKTQVLSIEEDPDEIRLELNYHLYNQDSFMSENRTIIIISSTPALAEEVKEC